MRPGWIVLAIVAGLVSGASISALAATTEITMDKLEIAPAQVSAKVGDTIEWVNKDPFAHTATAKDGAFDVMLPPNKSGSMVLKKAGTFEYYCRFHPNMKAVLTVTP